METARADTGVIYSSRCEVRDRPLFTISIILTTTT